MLAVLDPAKIKQEDFKMIALNKEYAVIPLVFPVDKVAAWTGQVFSMKNYHQAEIYFMTGGTFVLSALVTLDQGPTIADCDTALGFDLYYTTGMMLKYDGASTGVGAAPGETAQGAGGGIITINEDLNGILIGHWDNVTAFVDNEVLTFSGGKTAVVDGIRYNEDIMVPTVLAAGTDTFTVTQVLDVNKIFMIPVNSSMLAEGLDCVELNMADCDTVTIIAAWAILSQPRYAGMPMPTAIYD